MSSVTTLIWIHLKSDDADILVLIKEAPTDHMAVQELEIPKVCHKFNFSLYFNAPSDQKPECLSADTWGLFLIHYFMPLVPSLLCPSACDQWQRAILIDASFPKMHVEDRGEGRLAGWRSYKQECTCASLRLFEGGHPCVNQALSTGVPHIKVEISLFSWVPEWKQRLLSSSAPTLMLLH